MYSGSSADQLKKELEGRVEDRLGPVFQRYGLDIRDLMTPLKWKPLVLVIGNYSSGKSTFINELLGVQAQRTGQAPTDDSFTIITTPEEQEEEGEVPGNTVVSDDRLPFASLRRFGESLIAHLKMKKINVPLLQDLAIVDTPGMLDSVTEKDRGYDYLGVVGDLARMADLIILMFDPHKAGTIKETYQAIRTTLPESAGEDRVLYVLNRIDECENVVDLIRSYGTLCWNLSQMTGRKDMPRIYLTFAPKEGENVPSELRIWMNERNELKNAIGSAPRMRLFHILHEIDRACRELALEVEALSSFRGGFMEKLKDTAKFGMLVCITAFLLGDVFMKLFLGYPDTTFLESLFKGTTSTTNLIWPLVWAMIVIASTTLLVQRFQFPRYVKKTIQNLDSLLTLDTTYKKDLWARIRDRLRLMLEKQAKRQLWVAHSRNLKRLNAFLDQDIRTFYEKIKEKA